MRYKAIIEYDGSKFSGWQYQGHTTNSVQEIIEKAIFDFVSYKVRTFVSGRTDAGVHALGQVIHFDLDSNIETYIIRNALNYYLRFHSISILSVELMNDDFHARFSAKRRHYIYKIVNRYAPLTIENNRAWKISTKLCVDNMYEASKYMLGNHDFSSFRAKGCQSSSPVKTIDHIEFITYGSQHIDINISAKSFLYKQVRIIVGTLVECGKYIIFPEDISKILSKKDRSTAGSTAPPYGLYLAKIDY